MITYAPDSDKTTPDTLIDLSNLVPTVAGGYRTVNAVNASNKSSSTNFPGVFRGMYLTTLPDGTLRLFWACDESVSPTKTRLYRATSYGGAAANVSKAPEYALATKYRFATFGKYIITVNGVGKDTPQYYLEGTSTLFADLGNGVPTSAALCETVLDWVFMADYVSGGTTYSDGWITCNLDDPTVWNGGHASQQYSGRLYDPSGPITAIKRLHDNVVIYKQNAIYLGTKIDSTLGWAWTYVGVSTGAMNQECVVPVGNVHYYFDPRNLDFYVFDGTRARPIGGQARRGLLKTLMGAVTISPTGNVMQGIHDAANRQVVWFYDPVASGTTFNGYLHAFVAYNYETGQWGKGQLTDKIQWLASDRTLSQYASAPLSTFRPGIVCLAGYYDTVGGNNFYGAPLSGNTVECTFQTAYVGNRMTSTRVNGVIPHFAGPDDNGNSGVPGSGSMTMKYYNPPVTGASPSSTSGTWNSTQLKFEILQDAKFQSASCTLTPSTNQTTHWEITGIEFEGYPAGRQ